MTMGSSYSKMKESEMTRYKFKGYTISNCGYHQPDHCVWWEAVDENGGACFHGNTLREVEFMILDDEWEQKMRKMRDALERIVSLTNSLDENCGVDPVEIRDIARNALSEGGCHVK